MNWLYAAFIALVMSLSVRMWMPEDIGPVVKILVAIGGAVVCSVLMLVIGYTCRWIQIKFERYEREDGEPMVNISIGTKR